MAALRIILLAAAVAGVLIRPWRAPAWTAPVAMLLIGSAVGAISVRAATDAVDPLVEPLAFLLLAVPMALMLDQIGFFAAVASRIDHGRRFSLWLWIFAAAVTTLFNLDASVVLLTPLYVRLARRHGTDALAAGFVPVLLACFASSALVVSNLTNLLAAEHFDVDTTDFLVHLGPASLAATIVGYLAFTRAFPAPRAIGGDDDPVPERALRRGVPIVVFVLIGFTLGEVIGVPLWVIAAIADVILLVLLRRLPWRSLPVGAAILATALGVLAAVAAPHLHLGALFGDRSAVRVLLVLGLSIVAANAVNNLPAFLVAMPAMGPQPGALLWAVLLGVNLGPVLVVTGSLAGLLWLATMDRLGVPVDARTYSRIGVRVGLPAIAAAATVLMIANVIA